MSVHFYNHEVQGQIIWDDVARRLKVPNEFREHVGQLIFEHLKPAQFSANGVDFVSDKALRRLAHTLGDRLDDLFYLSLADITSHKPEVVAEKRENCLKLKERLDKILESENVAELKLPAGTGTAIAEALGIEPGPELGRVMKHLQQMLIDGETDSNSDFASLAKEFYFDTDV